jgi:acyl-coenzyme A synthetase/AMP-(fatty) acid ligase
MSSNSQPSKSSTALSTLTSTFQDDLVITSKMRLLLKEYLPFVVPLSGKKLGQIFPQNIGSKYKSFTQNHESDPEYYDKLPSLFLNQLMQGIHRKDHQILIEDEFLSLTGLESKLKINEYMECLKQVSSEGGYVAIALPSSSSQGLVILAVLLSKRIPVIVYPTTADKVLPALHQSGRLQAVICQNQTELTSLTVGKLFLGRDGIMTSINVKATDLPIHFGNDSYRTPPALVIYTSGSSGNPKPVAISFKCLDYIVRLMVEVLKLDTNTISSISMPLFHTLALNTQFLPTIMAGGRCVFSPAELQLNALFRGIAKDNGNNLALIPDVLVQCFHEFVVKGLEPNRKVKSIVLAGANIRSEHLKMAERLFPSAEIFKGYGLTEAIRVTMISNRDPDFHEDNSGYPLEGQTVSIRSATGKELFSHEEGQIFIKGPNTSNYYLGVDRPLLGEDGFLATGDTGYMTKKGQLVVLGRADRVFKSQGRKIAPLEIEKIALVDSSIAQAICIPKFCQHKGFRATLFLRLTGGTDSMPWQTLAEKIEKSIKSSLEPFKRPKEVFLSVELPKLATGKIDLEALKMHANLNQIKVKELFRYKGIDFIFHDGALLNRKPELVSKASIPNQDEGHC